MRTSPVFNLKCILKLFCETLSKWKWNKLFPLLLAVLSMSSCYNAKNINYLQGKYSDLSLPLQKAKYTVQPNDLLSIKIQSRDPDQAAYFNTTSTENRTSQANPASLFLTGYTVDSEGMINLAIVGKLKVSGLTIEEITNLIQFEVDEYLLNSIVSVKLTNFTVSVLGDVRNPGTNYIYNAQVNIFQALSAAGDLNLSAKRKTVKLIRQKGDESIVTTLDLTDPTIIESPYYFLQPNDVIYVDTARPKVSQSNLGVFALVLSAISTTVLVLNFTTN
ncbi:polysaccharide biosynthesis/export family protein [Pareuzebyella sediminis]|uniref:polysaccharide biosynthesis/export family protein n=1 Tax=Pareuzebyella sediminis TaxID=2607998 RepID=UPI0011EE7AA4|nr:polysaccharide biosynthesis/export family protein [Pareuzebyella sediminis]